MTESQYRRSNRTVLALIVVILVYFVMVMGARTFTLDADLGTYLRVGVPVLMLVRSFPMFCGRIRRRGRWV